ncbi:MAG: DUF2935 domain-containing protein [Butyrivibrio sp.]
MMENYVTLSIETHLFFARIMKEHALFLEAGFPCKNKEWIQKSDCLRQQFEKLLSQVVQIANGKINQCILSSNELVTEFTIEAEKKTECLSGISIDTSISMAEKNLRSGFRCENTREFSFRIHRINEYALSLISSLIEFKENILEEVKSGNLFTTNYPLLIEHIIREAKLYHETIENLMRGRQISYRQLLGTEMFWNQIMMEHALFIRGLLDPSEEKLIDTADDFASEYKMLLETAGNRDFKAMDELTRKSLEETLKYRDFKAAGTKGILNCDIASIIIPLLADHVLREANHYIRILQCGRNS